MRSDHPAALPVAPLLALQAAYDADPIARVEPLGALARLGTDRDGVDVDDVRLRPTGCDRAGTRPGAGGRSGRRRAHRRTRGGGQGPDEADAVHGQPQVGCAGR